MNRARDGDLYKTVTVRGRTFELYYGYYEDYERQSGEPVPIYPDLVSAPVYTDDGLPLVTQMQALCEHGDSRFEDGLCVDCRYFLHGEDLIGVCSCEEKRKNINVINERKNEK